MGKKQATITLPLSKWKIISEALTIAATERYMTAMQTNHRVHSAAWERQSDVFDGLKKEVDAIVDAGNTELLEIPDVEA